MEKTRQLMMLKEGHHQARKMKDYLHLPTMISILSIPVNNFNKLSTPANNSVLRILLSAVTITLLLITRQHRGVATVAVLQVVQEVPMHIWPFTTWWPVLILGLLLCTCAGRIESVRVELCDFLNQNGDKYKEAKFVITCIGQFLSPETYYPPVKRWDRYLPRLLRYGP